MYAILGITGQVGGAVANALLNAGQAVRAVVRDTGKGEIWRQRGCDVALADSSDAAALAQAMRGAAGVFIMTPPNYDPAPGFPQTLAYALALCTAINAARPAKVVFLSTIGAQVTEPNLLNNAAIMETMLRNLDVPVALLRPGWFMENAQWDLAAARDGVIPTFLQPLDHAIPMVATADIGQAAAQLLQESWRGVRTVELEGPRRYSANDIAAAYAAALDRDVTMAALPRAGWEARLRAEGMTNPLPRMRMVDGFNEGWMAFEGDTIKASTTLQEVLRDIVSRGTF